MAFFKVVSNNAEGQGPKYHDDNAIRDVLGYVLAEKKCPSGCKCIYFLMGIFPMDQRKELTDFCIRWKLIIQKNEHTASDLMR